MSLLEEEQKALANAEQIRERLATALACFRPGEGESLSESLRDARKSLDQAGRFLADVLPLSERLESARIELEDIFATVEDAASDSSDPGSRLEEVEERLSLLYRLMRKHGCRSVSKVSKNSRRGPTKAFTERGLYMLATILKGERARNVTFTIIETFFKVRSLKRELLALHNETDKEKQKTKMQHFGEVLSDIVMPDLQTSETESSLEINFFIGKIKHTVKRVRREDPKK